MVTINEMILVATIIGGVGLLVGFLLGQWSHIKMWGVEEE